MSLTKKKKWYIIIKRQLSYSVTLLAWSLSLFAKPSAFRTAVGLTEQVIVDIPILVHQVPAITNQNSNIWCKDNIKNWPSTSWESISRLMNLYPRCHTMFNLYLTVHTIAKWFVVIKKREREIEAKTKELFRIFITWQVSEVFIYQWRSVINYSYFLMRKVRIIK